VVRRKRPVSPAAIFPSFDGEGRAILEHQSGSRIYAQGEPSCCLFHIQKGVVRLAFASREGKEVTFSLRGPGDFFGEEALAGQPRRTSSAIAFSACTVLKVEPEAMRNLIRTTPSFAEKVVVAAVRQGLRQQAVLIDHLSASSEKRLARLLLALAELTRRQPGQPSLPRISQELMAEMIGTTRGRVSFFMNKFRRLGFVDYNGGLRVNSSLLRSIAA